MSVVKPSFQPLIITEYSPLLSWEIEVGFEVCFVGYKGCFIPEESIQLIFV